MRALPWYSRMLVRDARLTEQTRYSRMNELVSSLTSIQLRLLTCDAILSHHDVIHPEAAVKETLTGGWANRKAGLRTSNFPIDELNKLWSSFVLQTWVF